MRSRIALILLHLLGNALLLWLGYRWLGLDESDGSHLLGSFALAAVIVLSFAWLHSLALIQFSGFPLLKAVMRSLLSLIPFTLLGLVAIAIYSALAWVQAKYSQPAFAIASFMTLHLRRPIPPAAIQHVFHFLVLIFEWGIVPAALLPLGAKIATAGWSGVRSGPVRRRSFLRFAIVAAAILFCSIWVPLRLFSWIPDIASFNGQFASLLGRIGFGYLLFVFGVLLMEFVTVAGSPAETQPSTVASP